MLVLSRKQYETIVLHTNDGPIEVTIVDIQHNKIVKLGVTCSKSINIVRKEIDDGKHGPRSDT
jgi:carbon storage regulator CsrA